jgi:hypothetical protein
MANSMVCLGFTVAWARPVWGGWDGIENWLYDTRWQDGVLSHQAATVRATKMNNKLGILGEYERPHYQVVAVVREATGRIREMDMRRLAELNIPWPGVNCKLCNDEKFISQGDAYLDAQIGPVECPDCNSQYEAPSDHTMVNPYGYDIDNTDYAGEFGYEVEKYP